MEDRNRRGMAMSIIIKGMDMPKNCYGCSFFGDGIYCGIIDNDTEALILKPEEKKANCPLVEIPTPHGRLIDEDEITFHKHLEATENGQYDEILVVYERDIDLAPTILEAED